MKTTTAIAILLATTTPLFAEPAPPAEGDVPIVEATHNSVWRVSVGWRAAPGFKSSARFDSRAAVGAAGGALRSFGNGEVLHSTSTELVGSSFTGTTESDAMAGSGYVEGKTHYDFDNGYVDFDDGADHPGDTTNWHFDSADAFADGYVSAEQNYSGTTVTRTRTVETETVVTASFGEDFTDGAGGSSSGTAHGVDLQVARTLWQGKDFCVDFGIGWTWYADVDVFSVAGRAYTANAAIASESEAVATITETSVTESGTVATLFSAPEFIDADDIKNDDGTIGGAYVFDSDNPFNPPQDGYRTPILSVTSDRFSVETRANPTVTDVRTIANGTTTYGSSQSAARAVDVRSEGTLSQLELRAGLQPCWRATDWLTLRADAGVVVSHTELEVTTRLLVDGGALAALHGEKDEWNVGGYAGVSAAVSLTDRIDVTGGAELRFPRHKMRYDDGVVSGSVDLSSWSAFAAVGYRF